MAEIRKAGDAQGPGRTEIRNADDAKGWMFQIERKLATEEVDRVAMVQEIPDQVANVTLHAAGRRQAGVVESDSQGSSARPGGHDTGESVSIFSRPRVQKIGISSRAA